MSERLYKFWAFEKTNECYDCGQAEVTHFEYPFEHASLTPEEFQDFLEGTRLLGRSCEFMFLYMPPPVTVSSDAPTRVQTMIESGRVSKKAKEERYALAVAKAAEKAAKVEKAAAEKALREAEEERKTFEKLKKKFA